MVPSAFVKLDAMPLTPNGKVDRKVLPESGENAVLMPAYEAPLGPVEKVLSGIWEELLGVEKIGRHDNFFDLGGHSLLVMSLLDRLEKWGFNLPISKIFEFPTIASMCDSIIKDRVRTFDSDCLVVMKEGDEEVVPLFLIHDGGGDVLSYTGLVGFLDGDAPVYGLRAIGIDPDGSDISSVENIASKYMKEILRFCKNDVVRLAGWSTGGVIAYEIARQLSLAGVYVDFVVMIDSYVPGVVGMGGRDVSMKSVALGLVLSLNRGLKDIELDMVKNMQDIEDVLCECRRLGFIPLGVSVEELIGWVKVLHKMFLALCVYRPSGFVGNSYLLVAEHKSMDENSAIFDEADVRGWEGVGHGAIKVVNIGGNHETIMQPPYLKMVADKLKELMK